jgi:hypothetical protein
MALLVHPPGEGRVRLMCHSLLCRGEGVWLAGFALVCLFEGFWVVFWVVLRVFRWVCWGFSYGFALAPFVYSLCN